MRIKTLEATGIGPAIRAMRNPYESYERSDTVLGRIGERDAELAESLAKAGPPHCKHLRMIQVWAEIWAPRFWWQEFDTNRIGVEKVSCSTMHKLTSRPLSREDFEWDGKMSDLDELIRWLNIRILAHNTAKTEEEKERAFRILKQSLPESFIQRRTVMMSYQALRNMYEQRKGHRLKEWQIFRSWCETLPEAWLITGRDVLPFSEPPTDDDDDE